MTIKKYRKKPVVIEAVQWDGSGSNDGPNSGLSIIRWIRANGGKADVTRNYIHITTLEGEMRAEWGDWIIRGVNGEFYPCKPSIFAKTYEEEQE